ncbi:MAG TPA: hypothetical protein VK590_04320 [Saprospiraceae bacterium]|nr:hypothetical protein [Saprospiraceae bacterium]
MLKSLYISFTILFLSTINFSCKTRGCTDDRALNYNVNATENDGNCNFSNLIFYQKNTSYLLDGFTKKVKYVEITVQGVYTGFCNYAYGNYPPTECKGFGTVQYQIINGKKFIWTSKIIFTDGSTRNWQGTGQADPGQDCIIICAEKL